MKAKKGIRIVLLFWVLGLVAASILIAGAALQYFSPSLNNKIIGLLETANHEYAKHFSQSESKKSEALIAATQVGDTETNPTREETIESGDKVRSKYQDAHMEKNEPRSIELSNIVSDDYGFIYVKSSPEGAMVRIDGGKVGNAPVTAKVSPSGVYHVEVLSKYYDVFETSAKVYPGEVAKIHANLEKGEGNLTVISIPEEAEVYLDGESKGKSPLTIKRVEAGPHNLYVVKDNQEYEANIDIPAGENIIVDTSLQILKTSLSVKSKPEGATVYLNGKKRGKTPVHINDVKIGRHRIVLVKKNSAYVDSIQVSPRKDNDINVSLKNKDDFPEIFSARLKISSELKNAFTYVNGIYCGLAPSDIDKIKIGDNEILVVKNADDGSYIYKTTLSFDTHETKEVAIKASEFMFKKRN